MEERLIKRLMTSIKCDLCGQHYEGYNIDVLGHSEELWFLRALCSSCHAQCLVAAVVKESRRHGLNTDLTDVELDKFVGVDVIRADDVLDMHNVLKDFDGDFSRLFGQE